jgi:hypothetical protein
MLGKKQKPALRGGLLIAFIWQWCFGSAKVGCCIGADYGFVNELLKSNIQSSFLIH